jgi:hypothetical protein
MDMAWAFLLLGLGRCSHIRCRADAVDLLPQIQIPSKQLWVFVDVFVKTFRHELSAKGSGLALKVLVFLYFWQKVYRYSLKV